MNKLNLLSRAEMKKVVGGLRDPKACDESNGTYYTSICHAGYYFDPNTGSYVWAPSYSTPDLTTWDATQPCGGQCQGYCEPFFACDEQPVT